MIIGVDLDDVLLSFNEAMCIFHNRQYGTSYAPEDVTRYDIENIWGCSLEEAVKRILEFYQSREHSEAKPILGAVSAIAELKQRGHKVHIVTAKPENLRQITANWLDKHFPKMLDGVHFTNQVHGKNKKCKSEVCDKLGIKIFVEDSMDNARDIAKSGRPVLLLNRPWNQGETPEGVTRVYSWEEIVKKLNL